MHQVLFVMGYAVERRQYGIAFLWSYVRSVDTTVPDYESKVMFRSLQSTLSVAERVKLPLSTCPSARDPAGDLAAAVI